MISLRSAVEAFQHSEASADYWAEHGISEEECAQGLRAVFQSAGIEYADDCLFRHGSLTTEEEIEKDRIREEQRIEEHRLWRIANPEAAAQQDRLRASLEESSKKIQDLLIYNVMNMTMAGPSDFTEPD